MRGDKSHSVQGQAVNYQNLRELLLSNHNEICEKTSTQQNKIFVIQALFTDPESGKSSIYEIIVTFINVLSPFSLICLKEEV